MLEKKTNLFRLLVSIAILAFFLSLGSSSTAKSSGQWVPTSAASGCPNGISGGCSQNQVCADWDVDGETLLSCCISGQYLQSSFFEACGQ